MKRGWQAATVALLVLFGFFAYESLQLSLRDTLGPGPGFFPFWLSVLGGVLGLMLLIQLKLGRADLGAEALAFERAGVRSVVLVVVGLVAATALLDLAGFRLSMLIFNAYVLVALGVRNWIVVAVFAGAGSFGVYHVFYDLLKVPLPEGILGI
jgi:putative tricarboxylic transport membrane protein